MRTRSSSTARAALRSQRDGLVQWRLPIDTDPATLLSTVRETGVEVDA